MRIHCIVLSTCCVSLIFLYPQNIFESNKIQSSVSTFNYCDATGKGVDGWKRVWRQDLQEPECGTSWILHPPLAPAWVGESVGSMCVLCVCVCVCACMPVCMHVCALGEALSFKI